MTYVIALTNVTDREKHEKEFIPAIMKTHEAFDTRIISRIDNPEVLLGDVSENRIVLIEFQDKAHVKAWFNNPDTIHALNIARECTGGMTLIILEEEPKLEEAPAPESEKQPESSTESTTA